VARGRLDRYDERSDRWITQGGDRVAKGKSMQKEKKKPKQKKK
jgi:hypothetical protein